jgi:hypothetical protein
LNVDAILFAASSDATPRSAVVLDQCQKITTARERYQRTGVGVVFGRMRNTRCSAPNSANIINFIGSTVTLHPDFGSGTFHNQTIGIPYQVVAGTQPKVTVTLGTFASESDPGPEPIPSNALIGGYPKPSNSGDRHVLVLEKDGCWLYELYHAAISKSGQWSADSTAIWDMTINEQRPYTWTSADAAGLPIFVGLARFNEVAACAINHALRFTVPTARNGSDLW